MNALWLAVVMAAAPSWGPALEWKEVGLTRRAWVSPVEVLEIAPDTAGEAAVRALDATASGVTWGGRGGGRLWTVRDANALRARLPAAVSSRFIPVLHQTRNTWSPARAAVGGVVVVFNRSVPSGERAAWLRARGLTTWTPLGEDSAQVPSGPHEAAFALAAKVAGEPGVAWAAPVLLVRGVTK